MKVQRCQPLIENTIAQHDRSISAHELRALEPPALRRSRERGYRLQRVAMDRPLPGKKHDSVPPVALWHAQTNVLGADSEQRSTKLIGAICYQPPRQPSQCFNLSVPAPNGAPY